MTEKQSVGYAERWQIMLPATQDSPEEKPAPGYEAFDNWTMAYLTMQGAQVRGELSRSAWLKGFNVPVYRPEDVVVVIDNHTISGGGFAEDDGEARP